MTICQRLTFSFSLILGLFALVIGVNLWVDAQQNALFKRLHLASSRQLLLLEIAHQFDQRLKAVQLFHDLKLNFKLNTLTAEEIAEINSKLNQITVLTQQLLAKSKIDRAQFSQVSEFIHNYEKIKNRWLELYLHPDQALLELPEQAIQLAQQQLSVLKVSTEQSLLHLNRLNDDIARFLTLLNLALLILAAFFLLLIGSYFARSLKSNLAVLKQGIETIATGQIDHTVKSAGHDELAELAQSINRMAAALSVDLKEAHAVQQEAEQANRSKDMLLAALSQNLHSPLKSIIGYSELLMENARYKGLKSFSGDLQKIHEAGKKLHGIMNDILAYAKIETGEIALKPEHFPLQKLLDEALKGIRPLAEANNSRLFVHCPETLDDLYADYHMLKHALSNVLGLACKIAPNAHVHLHVEHQRINENDEIHFIIVNSKSDSLADLFCEQQAPKTAAYLSRCHELEFVVSQRLCQIMGGSITVERKGSETKFSLALPLAVSELKIEPSQAPLSLVYQSLC